MELLLVRQGPYDLRKPTKGVLYNSNDLSKPLLYTMENPGCNVWSDGHWGGAKTEILMPDSKKNLNGRAIAEGIYKLGNLVPMFYGIHGIQMFPQHSLNGFGLHMHSGYAMVHQSAVDAVTDAKGSELAQKHLDNYRLRNNLTKGNESHSMGCPMVSTTKFIFDEFGFCIGSSSVLETNAFLKKHIAPYVDTKTRLVITESSKL